MARLALAIVGGAEAACADGVRQEDVVAPTEAVLSLGGSDSALRVRSPGAPLVRTTWWG
jgi:hypothetical protein